MFDVGFWEISLILIVMLIVIGPERLPGLARKAGYWISKARRMVAEVKSEVDRELQLEELKDSIKQQTGLDEFKQLAREVRQEVNSMETRTREETHAIESDVRSVLDKKDLPSNSAEPTVPLDSATKILKKTTETEHEANKVTNHPMATQHKQASGPQDLLKPLEKSPKRTDSSGK